MTDSWQCNSDQLQWGWLPTSPRLLALTIRLLALTIRLLALTIGPLALTIRPLAQGHHR
jgi:hypothetical protein